MVNHNYDFHVHTNVSDGTLTPSQLLEMAEEASIEYLSITDHDSVESYEKIEQQGIEYRLNLIPGCEFTCIHEKQVLHIVGLNLDLKDKSLNSHLAAMKELRIGRAKKIAERLVKAGLPDLFEKAMQKSGEGQVGRPHFAQVMVDSGLVSDHEQAFKKYIGRGKAGDVKVVWPSMKKILDLIKGAGGISVFAHPTKYNLTLSKIRYFVAEFKECGGDALEISYSSIKLDQQRSLGFIADKNDLMVSAGSDFHSPEYHWTKLGTFPAVPKEIPHVLDKILEKNAEEVL